MQRGTSGASAADNVSSALSTVQQRVDDIQSELGGLLTENPVSAMGSHTLHSLATIGATAAAPPSAVVSASAPACPRSITELQAELASHPAFGAISTGKSAVSEVPAAVTALCTGLPEASAGIVSQLLAQATSVANGTSPPATLAEAAVLISENSSKSSSPMQAQLSALLLLAEHLASAPDSLLPGAVDLQHLYNLAVPLPDMLLKEALNVPIEPHQLVAGELSLAMVAGAADVDQVKLRASNLRNRFTTIAALGAPVTHGKWYFEAHLENSDMCQVRSMHCPFFSLVHAS